MPCLGLAHWTSTHEKLLAQLQNLLVLEDWTGLIFEL